MTRKRAIDELIIASAWSAPTEHWRYDRDERTFERNAGRRPAGYHVAAETDDPHDPGRFVELPLVNAIRKRVADWRDAGWPGTTGTTRRLLEHWRRPERDPRLFFCQLEAAETLIWHAEAPETARTGIHVPGDGGPFPRLCSKMATGTGKTVVMAMAIAWHVLNRIASPRDPRFSRNVLVMAPGLTVRNRLRVLDPSASGNYYAEFDLVPSALRERLRRGRVVLRNWHSLDVKPKQAKSVDKRGPKSDAAWVRDVLGEMAREKRILVVNDEAHHAWRLPEGAKAKKTLVDQTKWIGALDRLHRVRGVLGCLDFSATPFTPALSNRSEALFAWTVSDFGLNDAIESGLVKTPRVVVKDDASTDRSRLFHIYKDDEVKEDLNRRSQPGDPLPDLVLNAYDLLGHDWDRTRRKWEELGHATRPVLITVANRTETAARIKRAFDAGKVRIAALKDPGRTLHIDSKVLEAAEKVEGVRSGNANQKERAEKLRRQVDTVGKPGAPGERIQNVISVDMLSEGWDARTVTHIMGLRAFTSQLLCEQAVGRGLRRISWDVDKETRRFAPEYVNVFGIPFPFLPHEEDGPEPPPPKPRRMVATVPGRERFRIAWPNVVRVAPSYRPLLSLGDFEPLELDAAKTARAAELAEIVDGVPDEERLSRIELAPEPRFQQVLFEAAADVYARIQPDWRGERGELLAQVARLVEQALRPDRIRVVPDRGARWRRLVVTFNMTRIVQHLWQAIRFESVERFELVLDPDEPMRSTGDMAAWHTSRPCHESKRSHVNLSVCDSGWERTVAEALDRSPVVGAWVKNDHLGFDIGYIHKGVTRKYVPDFLIRLTNGRRLVLEVKGVDSPKDRTKREFLDEWVKGVNADGRFGEWAWDVLFDPDEIDGLLARAAA